MIPLMEKEIVDRHSWLSKEEFMDLLSLSQAMPGVFAVNMATSIGYRLKGVLGAIFAILGNIIAPIAIIVLLAAFFQHFKGNHLIDSIFMGIRPAVVALIAAPVFSMARTAKISWRNFWIPLVAAALIYLWSVSPVVIILLAAIGGWFYGFIKDRRNKQ